MRQLFHVSLWNEKRRIKPRHRDPELCLFAEINPIAGMDMFGPNNLVSAPFLLKLFRRATI